MYKIPKFKNTNNFHINNSVQGETLEQKIERIVNNKEPIGQGNDTAPIIYTERKEGVRASTNIRTDRFEVAIEATEKIAKSYKAKREERAKAKNDGEPKPIQGDPNGGDAPKKE